MNLYSLPSFWSQVSGSSFELRFSDVENATSFWEGLKQADAGAKILFSYPSTKGTHTLKVEGDATKILSFLRMTRG